MKHKVLEKTPELVFLKEILTVITVNSFKYKYCKSIKPISLN